MKRRILRILCSLVMTLIFALQMVSTSSFAASGYDDPDASKVYLVGGSEELDETKTEDPGSGGVGYYDNGTYTNRDLLSAGDYYVQKQFDWANEDKSEGKITFKTKLNVTKEPTKAVYAFTPCEAHGFRQSTAVLNIEFLLRNYDQVDLIWMTADYDTTVPASSNNSGHANTTITMWKHNYSNIHITKDVGNDSDGNGKPDYLDILQVKMDPETGKGVINYGSDPNSRQDDRAVFDDDANSDWHGENGLGKKYWHYTQGGNNGVHFGISLYTGLYAYLDGKDNAAYLEGHDPVTMTSAANEPTAIYVSFDGLLDTRTAPSGVPYKQELDPLRTSGSFTYNDNWSYPLANYDCWGILNEMDKDGRYYSLGMNGDGTANEFCFVIGASSNSYTTVNGMDSIHNNAVHKNSLHYGLWNELLALSNPSIMVDANEDGAYVDDIQRISKDGQDDYLQGTLWNGAQRKKAYLNETAPTTKRAYFAFKDQYKYRFDYTYNDSFDDLDMPVVGISLEDTLSESFDVNISGDNNIEIKAFLGSELPATTTQSGMEFSYGEGDPLTVNYTVDNETGKVSFGFNNYRKDTEIEITIPVKVDDENVTDLTKWLGTNSDASLTVNLPDEDPIEYDVSSPKAHIEGYHIETNVIGGSIDPSRDIREGADCTISYAPENENYVLHSITVTGKDGTEYIFDSEDEWKDFKDSYAFTNVQQDWDITVVYVELTDITVTKIWDDMSNEGNTRPENLTITLTSNPTGFVTVSPTVTKQDNKWTYKWTGLRKYSDVEGKNAITYDFTEDTTDLSSYTPVYDKANWKVTNYLSTVNVTVNKVWDDNNDSDGVRPSSVTFQLLADGNAVRGKTVTLPYEGSLSYTFTGLPRYSGAAGGDEIVYTVQETTVPKWYTATTSTDGLTITNTHIRFVSTDLTGQKTLTGRAMKENDFEFKVEAADDVTKAAVTAEEVVLPANAKSPASADGTPADIALGSITFRAAGTYKFKVSEVIPSEATTTGGKTVYKGVTYDTSEKEVTVVVAKKADANELEITSITGNTKPDLSFTNTYSASGSYTPTGTKTLKGQSEVDDADAAGDEDAVEPADDEDKRNVPSDNDGVDASNNDDADANTNAPAVEEPADDRDEPVKPESSNPSDEDIVTGAAFNGNSGAPHFIIPVPMGKGSISIAAATPKGQEIPMALTKGQFKFEIKYVNGTTLAGKKVADGENEAASADEDHAVITFDTINYTTEGLNALFADGAATKDSDGYHISYIVREKKSTNTAFQFNPESYTIEVVITDDGEGNLTAALASGSQALAFTNRYVTDTATVPITGLKVLTTENGTRTLKAGDFKFTITPKDGAPWPAGQDKTVSNGAGGGVDFGSIEFTKEDIGDASSKTFTYEINEVNEGKTYFTYDTFTKTVKVTVTDDGKGHLTATTNPASAPLFTFDNEYEPEEVDETVTKDITVNKVLQGADLTAGQFTFKIAPADDETSAAVTGNKVVMPSPATAKNKADGTVEFGKITYKKAGTYKFTISEVIPDDAVNADGTKYADATDEEKAAGGFVKNDIRYNYDNKTYTAIVVIEDNEEGKLVVKSQKLSDNSTTAEFTNKKLHTDLIIEKKLDDFVDHAGNANVAFAFIITGTDGNGVKYRNSAAIEYSADSPATQRVIVKNVPLDLTISVEEMKNQNYELADGVDNPQTAQILTSGTDKNKYFVSFENKFNENINPEGGVVNKYNKTENGYAYQAKQ